MKKEIMKLMYSLLGERTLSSKTHVLETGFCLTRSITEAQVNNLDIFY